MKPSPYLLHDISSITHCETIICGEGSGEGKNAKKGEGKQGEAFTRISLFDNNLRPKGEEVKAKNRKRRTHAYACALGLFLNHSSPRASSLPTQASVEVCAEKWAPSRRRHHERRGRYRSKIPTARRDKGMPLRCRSGGFSKKAVISPK